MNIINIAKFYIHHDTSKMSMSRLYGLHYNINMCNILNRYMITRALELNETNNYYTEVQKEKLESKLAYPTSCTSCI